MFCSENNTCELTLPYSKGLKKTQTQIIDTLKQLKEVEDDLNLLKNDKNTCIYLFNHQLVESIIGLTKEYKKTKNEEEKKKLKNLIRELSQEYNEVSIQFLMNRKYDLTTELRSLRLAEHKKLKLLKKRR